MIKQNPQHTGGVDTIHRLGPGMQNAKALMGDPSNPSSFNGARLTIQRGGSSSVNTFESSLRFVKFSIITPPFPRNFLWNPNPSVPSHELSSLGVSSGFGV